MFDVSRAGQIKIGTSLPMVETDEGTALATVAATKETALPDSIV